MTSILRDRLALVTGASQGIGEAIARRLVDSGSRVILASRRSEVLSELSTELGNRANTCILDLADQASIRECAAKVEQDLDILVNCGGSYFGGSIEESPPERFRQLLDVNVLGPYALTRELLPTLRANGGQVVFVNSSIVLGDGRTAALFAATAHALRSIANSLRAEVNADGIRVLSVFPGRTATPRQRDIFSSENRSYSPDRLLQPDDIASTIVHALCSPRTAEHTEIFLRPMQNFAS